MLYLLFFIISVNGVVTPFSMESLTPSTPGNVLKPERAVIFGKYQFGDSTLVQKLQTS